MTKSITFSICLKLKMHGICRKTVSMSQTDVLSEDNKTYLTYPSHNNMVSYNGVLNIMTSRYLYLKMYRLYITNSLLLIDV